MIRLMIVDDESFIRMGIRTSIDWNANGITIVGEAGNGQEALAKLPELKPDILMTDIRMPLMDGLELTKLVKQQLPEAKVVILSGYNDFDYAKKAIQLGVEDFLLKPVGVEELLEVVTRLGRTIEEERHKAKKELALNYVINENLQQIKSNFLKFDLLAKSVRSDDLLAKARNLSIPLAGPRYLLFLIDMDDYYQLTEHYSQKQRETLQYSVMNITEEIVSSFGSGAIFYYEKQSLAGLLNLESYEDEQHRGMYADIQTNLRKYLKLSVTICEGTLAKDVSCLRESYENALIARDAKAYKGKNTVIRFADAVSKPSAQEVYLTAEIEQAFHRHLKALELSEMLAILSGLFTQFKQNSAPLDQVRSVCIRIGILSAKTLEELDLPIQSLFVNGFHPHLEVGKYEVLDDLHEWLKRLFSLFVEHIENRKGEKYTGIINLAMKYIENHYAEDIRVANLAEALYISPNYFSRLFKEETGSTFVDSLNQFRVDKAKALLKDPGLKSYEVAQKVGYGDEKYFRLIFKKYTGMTTREYRNRLY